jgi:hypothetical protein
VPIPDAQIVYQDRDKELHRCSIELTTSSYRPGVVADKSAAGFHLTGGARHGLAARGEGKAHHRLLEL